MAFGCATNEAEAPSEAQEGTAEGGGKTPAAQMEADEPDAAAGDPSGESSLDPALAEYEYPGAKFDGEFSMGNTKSVSYMSDDAFDRVVEFYKNKPLKTVEIADTRAYFSKDLPGGSFTVTINPLGEGTQIILREDKKG
jgi:hypothetical protein